MYMKDCAIVCGYPTNMDGTISPILKSRIDQAIELYHQKAIRYIIVSGGAVHNRFSEADCMKDYALKQKVSQDAILIENQAISTYHNMLYSQKIMQENHLETCYVVTNSWHVIKARHYARQFLKDYTMVSCKKPQGMSLLTVAFLHIYMPINMLMMRFKGYK